MSLRTVEPAVAHLRRELRAGRRCDGAFRDAAGSAVADRLRATAGRDRWRAATGLVLRGDAGRFPPHPCRIHVRAFAGGRRKHWFGGTESAFTAFGGVTAEVLLDNAGAPIPSRDVAGREVVANPKLHASARHRGFPGQGPCALQAAHQGQGRTRVRPCNVRRGRGARTFGSFAAPEAHPVQWCRDIAGPRVHGTTGEAPGQHRANAGGSSAMPALRGWRVRRAASWRPLARPAPRSQCRRCHAAPPPCRAWGCRRRGPAMRMHARHDLDRMRRRPKLAAIRDQRDSLEDEAVRPALKAPARPIRRWRPAARRPSPDTRRCSLARWNRWRTWPGRRPGTDLKRGRRIVQNRSCRPSAGRAACRPGPTPRICSSGRSAAAAGAARCRSPRTASSANGEMSSVMQSRRPRSLTGRFATVTSSRSGATAAACAQSVAAGFCKSPPRSPKPQLHQPEDGPVLHVAPRARSKCRWTTARWRRAIPA